MRAKFDRRVFQNWAAIPLVVSVHIEPNQILQLQKTNMRWNQKLSQIDSEVTTSQLQTQLIPSKASHALHER